MTEDEARALWREHCQPLLNAGEAVIYGSPEHLKLEREKQRLAKLRKARP